LSVRHVVKQVLHDDGGPHRPSARPGHGGGSSVLIRLRVRDGTVDGPRGHGQEATDHAGGGDGLPPKPKGLEGVKVVHGRQFGSGMTGGQQRQILLGYSTAVVGY
jgi:hypothetical protein